MPKRLSPRLVRRRKRMLWGAFFLFAVAAAAWGTFFTSVFTVRNVKIVVEGRSTVPIERIQEVVGDLKSKRANIVFLSSRALERRLLAALPELRQVTVKRTMLGLPFLSKHPGLINEVSISIQERDPAGAVCRAEPMTENTNLHCFLFDREGFLFSEVASSTPYVLDERNVEHRVRYRIFDSRTVSRLTETASHTLLGLAAVRLELTDIETTFITSEGWGLILSNDRPPGEQFEAARIVLEREIGPRRAGLEYIDATIKNRVYYRYRR